MMDIDRFVDDFLQHRSTYDPVKAREYYLRTRKLKGKASKADQEKAAEYEDYQKTDAELRVNKGLAGKKVVLNKKRRIGAAEQKLIRAKSIAKQIKDPLVRADALKKVASAEKKLNSVKKKSGATLKEVKPGQSIKTGAKAILKGKPAHTQPDKAGRLPGDPNYGDDPPKKRS